MCAFYFYSNPNKQTLFLDDIYVPPALKKFLTSGDTKEVTSNDCIIDIMKENDVLISGSDQSGKTSLCKKLYKEYRNRNFLPVYLFDKETAYKDIIDNRIKKAFAEQYENVEYDDELEYRLVVLIDQFQFANNKEKIIIDLQKYKKQVQLIHKTRRSIQ